MLERRTADVAFDRYLHARCLGLEPEYRRFDALGVLVVRDAYIDDGARLGRNDIGPDTAVDDADIDRGATLGIVQREEFLNDVGQFEYRAGARRWIQPRMRCLPCHLDDEAPHPFARRLELASAPE